MYGFIIIINIKRRSGIMINNNEYFKRMNVNVWLKTDNRDNNNNNNKRPLTPKSMPL